MPSCLTYALLPVLLELFTNMKGGLLLLSFKEADKLLSVRNGTVSEAVRRGEIRAYSLPGTNRFKVFRSDLEEWVRSTWIERERGNFPAPNKTADTVWE